MVIHGDADHLEQALDNAFKYTPPPGQVRVTADTANGIARITVSDSGLGIPADDMPRLFDRFYRGRNSGAAAGTGLGLAIAHWIVEQHRVEVTAPERR